MPLGLVPDPAVSVIQRKIEDQIIKLGRGLMIDGIEIQIDGH